MSGAFYCVADDRYFLGAVALVNSLRIHGHSEPIHVLDCGLSPARRELLATDALVVDPPASEELHPWLLKTVAPLAHPAEAAVLIDTDMIVTRSLAPLIERAAAGAVVAFENDTPRFVPEWGELLDLGEPRPGPYVSSGLVIAGGEEGARLLMLMDDRQRRVEIGRTIFGTRRGGLPLPLSRAGRPQRDPAHPHPGRVAGRPAEPARAEPAVRRRAPGATSARSAAATTTASAPYVLHHFHRKPWLDPIYHGLWSRLFARLLLGAGPRDPRRPRGRSAADAQRPAGQGGAGAGRRGGRLPPQGLEEERMTAAFYCVTGRDFFPGAVALLNSLRLLGHDEPLHVLDHGLEPHQRERLAAHANVVAAPPGETAAQPAEARPAARAARRRDRDPRHGPDRHPLARPAARGRRRGRPRGVRERLAAALPRVGRAPRTWARSGPGPT